MMNCSAKQVKWPKNALIATTSDVHVYASSALFPILRIPLSVVSYESDVWPDADAHVVGEAVATRTVDQHVGRRSNGGGVGGVGSYHQCKEEGRGFVAHLHCRLIHDREEHRRDRHILDQLSYQHGRKAHAQHNQDGVRANQANDTKGYLLGYARLRYRRAKHDGARQAHQRTPMAMSISASVRTFVNNITPMIVII